MNLNEQLYAPSEEKEEVEKQAETRISIRKSIKISYILIWFWLILIGAFLGILWSAYSLLISLREVGTFPLNTIFFLATTIVFSFFANYLSSTISLINHFKKEGYKAAFLILLGNIGGLILRHILSKQDEILFYLLIIIFINVFIAYLLYSERNQFVVDSGIRVFRKILICLLVIYFLLFPLAFYSLQVSEKILEEKLELAREELDQKLIEISRAREIEVFSWTTYKNQEFGFELEYPEGWYIEIEKIPATERLRTPDSPQETRIAFAEKEFPENYWNSSFPYFMVTIFPISKEPSYEFFKDNLSKIESNSDEYRAVSIGGIKGVEKNIFVPNREYDIQVEYKAHVFGLRLHRVLDENLNRVYCNISERVLSSFRFLD